MTLAKLRTIDDVRALLASTGPSRRLVPCEISELGLGHNAAFAVRSAPARLLASGHEPRNTELVSLVDSTPIRLRRVDLRGLVESTATRPLATTGAVVACGGGTIGDIEKLAADRARWRRPAGGADGGLLAGESSHAMVDRLPPDRRPSYVRNRIDKLPAPVAAEHRPRSPT